MLFFRVLSRLCGRFFSGISHILAGLWRLLRRYETALGVVVVTALVVGGFYLFLTALNINIVIGQPQANIPATVVTPTTDATPTAVPAPTAAVSYTNAPNATEAFMRGEVTFDANQIWDALGAELHTSLESRGNDKTALQQDLQKQKSSGIQYETYRYIGAYKNPEGSSIHFYVLRYRDSNNKINERTFTFRLGEDGKITSFALS
ncbi:MAG: hypothetical protein WCS37_13565 [Chloroflexota bacterium]|nr:hypothetical protein [Chloroflexota bacterium]